MIKVGELKFSYGKDKQILHGLNFEVKEGEIFGFLGPNGSGKSTTQKILNGVLKGYNGHVSLFGKEVKAFINKPVSSYSKGMKQRISMARALVSNPKLLFLDEPTSGLDPSGAVLFRKIIEEERKKGTTIFLTTHNMLDADLMCNNVAFIADGKIMVIDKPKNLKMKNSNNKVEVEFVYNGNRDIEIVDIQELESGITFKYDEILSVHSKEPTLEEVFIKYTGRMLV